MTEIFRESERGREGLGRGRPRHDRGSGAPDEGNALHPDETDGDQYETDRVFRSKEDKRVQANEV